MGAGWEGDTWGCDLPGHRTCTANSIRISGMEEKNYQGLIGSVRHCLDFMCHSETRIKPHDHVLRPEMCILTQKGNFFPPVSTRN